MRAAILTPTGSISPGSDISGLSPRPSVAGVFFFRRSRTLRMPLVVRERSNLSSPEGKPNLLRRVRSDTDIIRSVPPSTYGARLSTPELLAVSEEDDLASSVWKGASSAAVVKKNDEVEYTDGSGNGKESKGIGESFGDGGNEKNNGNRMIKNYYEEMLRVDQRNPLLLRNYGRFLHEVERDLKKAEEYYGRAILASPDDGELLSLYARLIWESEKDCNRAMAYHERAIKASPVDCYVLGSYAHFLWEAEEEEEEDEGIMPLSSPFVEAF